MPEWAQSLRNYIYRCIYPPTPPPTLISYAYGYRWQLGHGVPGALNIYNTAGSLPAGVYVAFTGSALSGVTDYFGIAAGCGPVFVPPPAVFAALTNLVASVASNPPPGQASYWSSPNPNQLRHIDGFLSYVDLCLNLVTMNPPRRC